MNIINLPRRRLFTGTFKQKACTHLDQVQDVQPEADVCLKCVELGPGVPATWPDIRVCMTCGHVGCCEDARNSVANGNAHVLKHCQETGHPIVRPYKVGLFSRWIWWGGEDEALLDLPA